MPSKSIDELPPAFKNLSPDEKKRGMAVFNALLARGMPEARAIPIALARAKGKAKEEEEDLEDDPVVVIVEIGDEGTHADHPPTASKKKSVRTARKIKAVSAPVKAQEGDMKPLREQAVLTEAVDDSGTIWDVRCIASGLSKNHTFYSQDVLQEAVGLFSGVPCFADHGDGNRSVRDVVGWFENSRLEDDGIHAEFHALEATDWFLGPMKEAFNRGKADLIGFSINGEGSRHADKVDGHMAYVVDNIRVIESVDGVINPSAGGQVVKLVAEASAKEEEELMALEQLSLDELKQTRPDLYDQIVAGTKEAYEAELKKVAEVAEAEDAIAIAKAKAKKKKDEEEEAKAQEAEEVKAKAEAEAKALKEEEDKTKSESQKLQEQTNEKLHETLAAMEKMRDEAEIARAEQRVGARIAETSLPQVIKDKLVRRFVGQKPTDEQVTEAIEDEETTLKALQDERPTSFPRIEMGEDQRDRAVKALDGLIAGEDVDGIPAARTIREAYAMFHNLPGWSEVSAHDILRETWSRNMTEGPAERLREERLREGLSVGSTFTQWGDVMADAIHKRLLALYRLPYLEDWRRVASSIVAVPDFKTQKRIRVGGYGNFASVAEAGSYATIATPSDEQATYAVTKYGAIEQLTLEAIANDDVGAVRRIPQQLARGAKTVLYETVMDHFRTNANVTYEAVALINNASHANSVAGASTVDGNLSDATLSHAKRLLAEQTELDSSKTLGLRGRYILIPPELEPNAIRLHDNEFAMALEGSAETEGTANISDRGRDVNVHRNSFETLVVPYWTDNTAWFVVGDPAQLPILEVGFYQGKQEPELFVQDMPNVGSNFEADTIKYKARIIFGSTVLDHRGIVGSSQETR